MEKTAANRKIRVQDFISQLVTDNLLPRAPEIEKIIRSETPPRKFLTCRQQLLLRESLKDMTSRLTGQYVMATMLITTINGLAEDLSR